MGDESENTQTQTQNSQIEWSGQNVSAAQIIPNIWGRLYQTNLNGRHWWINNNNPEYHGKPNRARVHFRKSFERLFCDQKTHDCQYQTNLNGRHWWINNNNPEYHDLIEPEFTLGRALSGSFAIRKHMIKDIILKNISKHHFVIRRDLQKPLCPAVITDLSHNGTFVNGEKIGKGNSRVLDDSDQIGITHELVQVFVFKDLLKNEQDKVPKLISQKYYISRTLGQGACGIVKLVYDKKKCTQHAMKIIKKSRLTNGQANKLNDPEKIMNEVLIMKALRHPCIISTEEVFDSRDTVYIILEYMPGGELFDRITKHGHLTESRTRFLFRQMVLAVKYLHSQGITHRDLKPENVLLESENDDTLVKITDFGLSKFVGEDSFMKTMCGTPVFLAPEVLRANGQKCYGPEVDVWSLGVIFFICLVGYLPFSADYKELSLRDQILAGKYFFSSPHWKNISMEAKFLMKRMLTVRVDQRITLDQILNHVWMQDHDDIIRVEKMLARVAHEKNLNQLSIASTSDEENCSNNDVKNVTVMRVAASGKRALSDNYSSCEPIPKKLRIDNYSSEDKNYDTSTTSYCSEG